MAILASDNFNRANGGLGANWTTIASMGAPQIVSNLIQTTSGRDGAYYSAITWPNDQYAQVTLIRYRNWAMVRVANVAGEYNGYMFLVSTSDITTAISIEKYLNNSGFTTLSSGTRTNSANDLIYLEIQGSTLIAKINAVQVLTGSDSAFASGRAGLAVGNVDGDRVDDFVGGDFSSGDTLFAQACL